MKLFLFFLLWINCIFSGATTLINEPRVCLDNFNGLSSEVWLSSLLLHIWFTWIGSFKWEMPNLVQRLSGPTFWKFESCTMDPSAVSVPEFLTPSNYHIMLATWSSERIIWINWLGFFPRVPKVSQFDQILCLVTPQFVLSIYQCPLIVC